MVLEIVRVGKSIPFSTSAATTPALLAIMNAQPCQIRDFVELLRLLRLLSAGTGAESK